MKRRSVMKAILIFPFVRIGRRFNFKELEALADSEGGFRLAEYRAAVKQLRAFK